jgi:hypothetical protein
MVSAPVVARIAWSIAPPKKMPETNTDGVLQFIADVLAPGLMMGAPRERQQRQG